jgi:hypothetical protein
MQLQPQIAEDVLALIESKPELTRTQVVILKMAAALLWQDESPESVWSLEKEEIDSRFRINSDEWELIPDRFELAHGVVCPKEWATPNRLMKGDLWESEFGTLLASGMEREAAMKLATQLVREKLIKRQKA